MSLYLYKKTPIKIKIHKSHKRVYTIADVLDSIISFFTKNLEDIHPISIVIPIIFIISGLSILYGQLKPYAIHYIQSKFTNKLNQEIINLVPESYESIRVKYITDPGVKYFSDVVGSKVVSDNTKNYKGTFYLTIEKIKIKNAPVTANVDSSSEKIYLNALSKGLAHFKGSCLPGDQCNILIYGHSAAGDYAERNPQDVVTAFTRLFNLNIGDTIKVTFEGKEYTYVVKKIKEISPEQFDTIDNVGNTLTLMTCSPPGLNRSRLIVVATQK